MSASPSPALRTSSHIPAAQLADTVTIGTYYERSPGTAVELFETNITAEGGHFFNLPQFWAVYLGVSR